MSGGGFSTEDTMTLCRQQLASISQLWSVQLPARATGPCDSARRHFPDTITTARLHWIIEISPGYPAIALGAAAKLG